MDINTATFETGLAPIASFAPLIPAKGFGGKYNEGVTGAKYSLTDAKLMPTVEKLGATVTK